VWWKSGRLVTTFVKAEVEPEEAICWFGAVSGEGFAVSGNERPFGASYWSFQYFQYDICRYRNN